MFLYSKLDQTLQRILIFKNLHPVRFWVVVGVMIFVLLVLIFWLYQIWKKYQKIRKEKETVWEYDSEDRSVEKTGVEIRQKTEIGQEFNFSGRPWYKHPFVRWYLPLILIFFGIITSAILRYKDQITHTVGPVNENLNISETPYIFGIDISHYQGRIDWQQVLKTQHPIEFIFIRATMGVDGKDAYYDYNWRKAKEHDFIRGAYHYYRPNENSTKQFNNFKKQVKIVPGDLPPVLDIEHYSKYGNENLRQGVLNWLNLAELHYGIKPIVYTGSDFYNQVLRGHIEEYPFWIADYTRPHHRLNNINWKFHQFTEKVRIKGIPSWVDGNNFKGELYDLLMLTFRLEENEEISEIQ